MDPARYARRLVLRASALLGSAQGNLEVLAISLVRLDAERLGLRFEGSPILRRDVLLTLPAAEATALGEALTALANGEGPSPEDQAAWQREGEERDPVGRILRERLEVGLALRAVEDLLGTSRSPGYSYPPTARGQHLDLVLVALYRLAARHRLVVRAELDTDQINPAELWALVAEPDSRLPAEAEFRLDLAEPQAGELQERAVIRIVPPAPGVELDVRVRYDDTDLPPATTLGELDGLLLALGGALSERDRGSSPGR